MRMRNILMSYLLAQTASFTVCASAINLPLYDEQIQTSRYVKALVDEINFPTYFINYKMKISDRDVFYNFIPYNGKMGSDRNVQQTSQYRMGLFVPTIILSSFIDLIQKLKKSSKKNPNAEIPYTLLAQLKVEPTTEKEKSLPEVGEFKILFNDDPLKRSEYNHVLFSGFDTRGEVKFYESRPDPVVKHRKAKNFNSK